MCIGMHVHVLVYVGEIERDRKHILYIHLRLVSLLKLFMLSLCILVEYFQLPVK